MLTMVAPREVGGGGEGVSKENCGIVRLPVLNVTSRVSDFQNGEQSVHRKNG